VEPTELNEVKSKKSRGKKQQRSNNTHTIEMSNLNIVLASQSPRRRELLELMQIPFTTVPAHIDETFDPELSITENIMSIAEQKARAVASKYTKLSDGTVVIGADTTVVYGEMPLGKPPDSEAAYGMLETLQGTTHEVMTGFAILHGESCRKGFETTRVTIAPMSEQEIQQYVSEHKPVDKAGSYGIQDPFMSCFIQRIEGCYYNVVGLPLSRIYSVLRHLTLL